MTRRTFLAAAAAQAAPARNVLLISVDDLNCDLGCYGHPLVQSPHIDRLARHGVRFDRAYCQYPVCNPSRTSLLSGFYPEATRVLNNTTDPRTQVKSKFLPEYLRSNGYYTARVGKLCHDGMDGASDWDHASNPRGTAKVATGEGRNLTGGKFAYFEWRASEAPEEEHPDAQTALEVSNLLADKRSKPFFIACGFRKPHDKYIAPKKYFDLYPLESIPGAVGPADDAADIPPAAFPQRDLKLGYEEGREFRRAYWACVSFMDAQVGKVLGALERNGLAQSTLVIFFSDHGLHLGEHGWWNKVALWERTTRVPLIVSGPGVPSSGEQSEAIVELLDLYPTITSWAGLRLPAAMPGKSLLAPASNRAAYTVVLRGEKLGRALRTDRYRYVEWDEGRLGAELYDHASDPLELRNVADDPDYRDRRAELRKWLSEKTRAASLLPLDRAGRLVRQVEKHAGDPVDG